MQHVKDEHATYRDSQADRTDLVALFEPLCDRRFECSFLRPLLTAVDLHDEYVGVPWRVQGMPQVNTKFDCLFEQCDDGQLFRKSVVEYLGVDDFELLHGLVTDVVAAMDQFSEDFLTLVTPFTEALKKFRAPNHRAGAVPDLFDQVYESYLDALKSSSYYLSPLELALVCQCARKNVVIARRVVGRRELQYDRHVMPVRDGPILFTAIQTPPGANRGRTHFERLERLS